MTDQKPKTFNPPRVTTVDEPPVKIRQDEPVMPLTSSATPITTQPEPETTIPQPSTKTSFSPPKLKGGSSKKSKIIATVLFLILMLISVPIGVYLVQQRQEIRKEAQTPPGSCEPGFDYCKDEKPCWNEGWSVTKNLTCGGDMTMVTISEPASSCHYDGEQGYHRFSVNLSKTRRLYDPDEGKDTHVKLRLKIWNCTCDQGCGEYLQEKIDEKLCVCVPCDEHWEDLEMPLGPENQTITFTQNVPLANGGCGSAQVDVWFYPVAYIGRPADIDNCQDAFAATVWLTGRDAEECDDPPVYNLSCELIESFDQAWNPIDPNVLLPGQMVRFAVNGTTDQPDGITQAMFRFNQGDWQTTTDQHEGKFYYDYQIPDNGTFDVDAMVHNPALGWK